VFLTEVEATWNLKRSVKAPRLFDVWYAIALYESVPSGHTTWEYAALGFEKLMFTGAGSYV
jgi:hypothetical protein